MRTRTFCAIAIGLLSLALTSCQNDLDLLKPSQDTEPEKITQLGSSIADGLVAHPSEGFYIIYTTSSEAVSYTHLDVYKRQLQRSFSRYLKKTILCSLLLPIWLFEGTPIQMA